MPLVDANIAGGNGVWVKDTNRFLAPSASIPISTLVNLVSPSSSVDSAISSGSSFLSSASSTLDDQEDVVVDSPVSSPGSSPSSSISSNFTKLSALFNRDGRSKSTSAAPMLSPASSTDSLDFFASATFLEAVFSKDHEIVRNALTVDGIDGWSLATVEIDGIKTLYAQGQCGFETTCARENVIALLDHADEEHECDQVVVVLRKKDHDLAQTLHSLMYIGGTVISPAKSAHDSKHVLVGLDL